MEFIQEHLVLSIIILIGIILLLFVVLIPGFFKLKNLLKKNKDSISLKNDLLIWKRIARLANGGNNYKAKNKVDPANIQAIKLSFEKIKATLKADYHGMYDNPWYMMLGEPNSGKSSLLEYSDLSIFASESDKIQEDGSKESPSIRFWNSNQAVIADISGKVFFDKWLEGSSVEWNEIILEIRKKHKKFPLNGVILTIPVDSLMADDESMTRKKADLMLSEINKLVNGLGMNLPFHVVITKMDMVTGFREYFQNVSDVVAREPFGWENTEKYYSNNGIRAYWNNLIEELRNGRNFIIGSREVLYHYNGKRLDLTSKVFMYTEIMKTLEDNLEIYLQTIFGKRKDSSYIANPLLEGVYFTSSIDKGISINKDLGIAQNKPIDESLLVSNVEKTRPLFIYDLLNDKILPDNDKATFTKKEIVGRQFYHYVAFFTMGIISFIWLFNAVFQNDQILLNKKFYIENYNLVSSLFSSNMANEINLIESDNSGNVTFLNQSAMPNDPLLLRQNFYANSYDLANNPWTSPVGFKVSSYLKYLSTDILNRKRTKMFTLLHAKMVKIPAFEALENDFIYNDNKEFTSDKRKALYNLLDLIDVEGFNDSKKYTFFDIKNFKQVLQYLFSDMQNEMVEMLSASKVLSKFDSSVINNSIVFDKNYVAGVEAGLESMLEAWENDSIYPYSKYKLERDLLRSGNDLVVFVENVLAYETPELDFYKIEPF